MRNNPEILEDYVVGLSHVRKYPRRELAERARVREI